jgi:hypothetical protein
MPRINWFSVVAYALTAVAVLVVGLTTTSPDTRSPLFWPRMLWAEALVFLAWAPWAVARISRNEPAPSSGWGGVLPTLSVVMCVYVTTASVLLLLQALAGDAIGFSWRAHAVAQALLTCAAGVLLASVASVTQLARVERAPLDVPSPLQLAAMLRAAESDLRRLAPGSTAATHADPLRTLGEAVQYTLPQTGEFVGLVEYRALARRIEALCHAARTPIGERRSLEDEASALLAQVRQLSTMHGVVR